MVALELRINIDLRRGAHAEVIPELRALLSVHPLREDVWATLMLALYRAGRQADALAAYREAREVLVESLGIEPGPALQALEQSVLAQSAELGLDHPSGSVAETEFAGTTIIGDTDTAPGAFLVLRDGSRVPLEGRCTVGRHPGSTIALDDPKASRHHCVIRPVAGGHLLSDLGSTNGTVVDDQLIAERSLCSNDEIRIGDTLLRYVLA